MNSHVIAINNATSCEELEEAITNLPPELVDNEEIVEALQVVVLKEYLNAKLRRRVKRLLENANKDEGSVSANSNDINTVEIWSNVLAKLKESQNSTQVEEILSSFPNELAGIDQFKGALLKLLIEIQDNDSLVTNAKSRRRIKRLIISLSSDGSEIEQMEATDHDENANMQTANSLEECIDLFERAKSTREIEWNLNNFSTAWLNSDENKHLIPNFKNTITYLINNKKLTNKMLRKRMQKLIYHLLTPEEKQALSLKDPTTEIDITPNKKKESNNSNNDGIKTDAKFPPKLDTIPAATKTEVLPIKSKSVAEAIEAFISAKTNEEVECSVSDINIKSVGNRVEIAKLQDLIKEAQKNTELQLNSKTKRKLKRVTETLDALNKKYDYTIALSQKKEPTVVDSKDILAVLHSSSNPTEVLHLLTSKFHSSTVQANISSKVKRKFKRCLLNFCNCACKVDDDIQTVLSNANISDSDKSSISRICAWLDKLQPVPPKRVEEKSVSKKDKLKKDKIPSQTLFIGQLDYALTEDDIRNHFINNGVKCDINIRLLKEKSSNKSRGIGFVDVFGDQKEVAKCISLHHTLVGSRRINIEKTDIIPSGPGSEEKKALDLKTERVKAKILHSEQVDELMREYEDKGILTPKAISDTLMNRIYALTISDVERILREFEEIQSDTRCLNNLEHLVYEVDNGGHAVDQARVSGGKRSRNRSRGGGPSMGSIKMNTQQTANSVQPTKRKGNDNGVAEIEGCKRSKINEISSVFPSFKGRGGKRIT